MTDFNALPPLPSYTLMPLPPLVPPISDKNLALLLPVAAYWSLSMLFHWMDVMDYFPHYRLHTPAEVLKRNRVSRWQVFRDVLIQQAVWAAAGWVVALTEPDDCYGREEYDVVVWARRIRLAERIIPNLLSLVGINASQLSKSLVAGHPMLAGALLGGRYPTLEEVAIVSGSNLPTTTSFAPWEVAFAKLIYWCLVPIVQFMFAILFLDTWQYFLHRAMHRNKWLYTNLHARHHRLYVPYAYGALYQNPLEGFLLDIVGAGTAFKLAGMSTRQGMCFFTGSTLKTVDDHSGYALPWDPLQRLTSNNAGYHDVHHQSWGIKTNFSQPFFTFWDRLLGTVWTGGDVSARYERSRAAAQKVMALDTANSITGSDTSMSAAKHTQPYVNDVQTDKGLYPILTENPQPQPPPGKAELQALSSRQQILEDNPVDGARVIAGESEEEKEAQDLFRRNPREATATSLSIQESLKGLSQRTAGNACIGGLSS
ncbi:MAG: hypothetical protein Q9163_003293 [Psora crenata]